MGVGDRAELAPDLKTAAALPVGFGASEFVWGAEREVWRELRDGRKARSGSSSFCKELEPALPCSWR